MHPLLSLISSVILIVSSVYNNDLLFFVTWIISSAFLLLHLFTMIYLTRRGEKLKIQYLFLGLLTTAMILSGIITLNRIIGLLFR